jgi:hypothetical protein
MSIEQTNTIDFVNIDRETGAIVLAISDHLEWSVDGEKHLLLLQEKLNTYMRFIESGELLIQFPAAVGKRVVVSIVGKFPMSDKASNFFDSAANSIRDAGFELKFSSISIS